MLWIITASILLLLFILCFVRLYISFHYSYNGEQQFLCVKVHLLHMPIYKKNIKHIGDVKQWTGKTIKEGGSSSIKKWEQMLRKTLSTLEKIQFHQLNWQTILGTGDAFSTGVIAGGAWTIKGSLIGALYEQGHFKCKPLISIEPCFQQKLFQTKINCIVSIKLGKAIYGSFLKNRKRRIKEEAFV